MKRHLLGFALFNLIVGASLLIALFTGRLTPPRATYSYETSRNSYRMKIRQNYNELKTYERNQDSIKITQAVLNEKANKLNLSFNIQRETPSTQDLTVKLTFTNSALKMRNETNGETQTEFVTLSPNFNVNNQAVYSMPLSYNWLNDFGRKENIYVKAEIYKGSSTDFENAARNRSAEFTPVLLMNKK